MGIIYWRGRSTDGIWKSKTEAASFLELFKELDLEKEIINSYEYSVYDHAVLEKYGKTEDDVEFQNEDGDLDYDKLQAFIEQQPDLTDKELWELIMSRTGQAYYQTFERDSNGEKIEIDDADFDSNGKYMY